MGFWKRKKKRSNLAGGKAKSKEQEASQAKVSSMNWRAGGMAFIRRFSILWFFVIDGNDEISLTRPRQF